MKKGFYKKLFFWIFAFLALFEFWCFYKVIFFDDSKSPWIVFLTDRNGEIITDKPNEFWYKKVWNLDLNSKFVKSLLLIEDKNFYLHFWVDVLAKIRALTSNIWAGEVVSWWSTITEQFLKNKYFYKDRRWYLQKLKEANLAFFFSIFYSKDDILKAYLENIYFWNNIYWIQWAIETYFWKQDLNQLTDEEITILLTLVRKPWVKSIKDKNFVNIFERIKKRLDFSFENKITKLNKKESIDRFPFVTKYFCEGKKVDCIGKTSIDANLQKFTKNTLNKTLNSLQWKNVTNGAVLAINPETMEVLVYLWSRDFANKTVDWQVDILEALRQPGSTMKPFLYLLALQKGAFANNFLIDLKSEYDSFEEGKTYFSENYSLKEYWLVRFQKALWNSLNNATVRLAKEIWLNEIFSYYKENWIKFLENDYQFYGYSLVLWNPSLTLKNLAVSYINLIPDFETRTDRKLNFYFVEKTEKVERKLDKNKFLLYKILQNPDNRDISFWVNSILNTSLSQAVKTWTSSNFKDNVVISYNKNFLLLVWVWNTDNSSMKWVTGITGAGYIWHQIVEEAILKWYLKKDDYMMPEWISKLDYCLDKNCFRKEVNYDKSEAKYDSRILERYFPEKDIFEKVSDLEKHQLKDLWFEIK